KEHAGKCKKNSHLGFRSGCLTERAYTSGLQDSHVTLHCREPYLARIAIQEDTTPELKTQQPPATLRCLRRTLVKGSEQTEHVFGINELSLGQPTARQDTA